ncbi:hypothetical protein LWI28_014704 [Acer negundo]|uniref:Uncharacterized protein n=1 Tax=Acer negundo TaxID=4023 RepID=A0AAD5IE21_ACENE|nr:hypothetical protein LWI28_014704 [Acer negundo]
MLERDQRRGKLVAGYAEQGVRTEQGRVRKSYEGNQHHPQKAEIYAKFEESREKVKALGYIHLSYQSVFIMNFAWRDPNAIIIKIFHRIDGFRRMINSRKYEESA